VLRVTPSPSTHRARRRGRTALVALATAVVLALGGGVYAVASDPPPGIDAPDAVGRGVDPTRDEVERLARDEGVDAPRVRVVDRAYSESVPAGEVLAQDPAPGERIVPGGALLLSVSKGTAFAEVPSVTGLATEDAFAVLRRAGFTPGRRYAPSTAVAAWHALDTDPVAGTTIERPARVVVVVSTGPPRIPVPSVAGLDADAAAETLRDAGFAAVVEERASSRAPGAVLGLEPAAGSRAPLGSSVTVVVARAPVWSPITQSTGSESASTGPLALPAGARLVLETDNRSFLDLFGASVVASWTGDAQGTAEVDAGDALVLVEPSGADRTVDVTLTVDGDASWSVVVEAPR
jgi:serine/threonine-protein kinase